MSRSPRRNASTASRLQSGHRDNVLLGTPLSICVRCLLFRRGPGAHLGRGKRPAGSTVLIGRSSFQTTFAVVQTESSFEKAIDSPPRTRAFGGQQTLSEVAGLTTTNKRSYCSCQVDFLKPMVSRVRCS